LKHARSVSPTLSSPSKKVKLQATYANVSPFPKFTRPTRKDAQEVHDLLVKTHRKHAPVRHAPKEESNSAETCGNVPNVIDSLIGTILSQNTNNKNSSSAKRSLDDVFGRHNFKAMAEAPVEDVVASIKHGGLANRKAKIIQNVLRSINEKHSSYSLQHLASPTYTDAAVMDELLSYDGVGPKTAACVLLFCLGRNAFAVDTHIYRLSKLLGWVPMKADRILAQAHLDLKIPEELKYGLHVLLIEHGKACKGCNTKGRGDCVLKTYLKERDGGDVDAKVEQVEEEMKNIKEEDLKPKPGHHWPT